LPKTCGLGTMEKAAKIVQTNDLDNVTTRIDVIMRGKALREGDG